MSPPETYVQIEDVAKYFAVSVSTVRAWLRQGYIPKDTYLKIGNTYRFKLKDVEASLVKSKSKETKVKEELVTAQTPQQLELNFNSDDDA
jgi:excisionase family DNA binding protein